MAYDWEDDDATATAGRARHVAGVVVAITSYVLFGLGIAAIASFFAPHVGFGGLAWHTGVLPTVAAPTEGDAVVDVAPLIVGIVASSVAVWLR